jgi:hypothetical protein
VILTIEPVAGVDFEIQSLAVTASMVHETISIWMGPVEGTQVSITRATEADVTLMVS